MAQSRYRMQILDLKTGKTVTWRAGGPMEADIPRELCDRLKKRGVGAFVTEATVLKAVEEEFAAILMMLKSEV